MQEPIEYAIDVALDISAGNAADAVAENFQLRGARRIGGDLRIAAVRGTVDLNDELSLPAEEISKIGTDGRLAHELAAAELAIA
jgi:hypothetical protein